GRSLREENLSREDCRKSELLSSLVSCIQTLALGERQVKLSYFSGGWSQRREGEPWLPAGNISVEECLCVSRETDHSGENSKQRLNDEASLELRYSGAYPTMSCWQR